MDLSLGFFLDQVTASPVLAITVLLTLGVILVNGWTDAPNAIATVVGTRSLGVNQAIIMAAVFNFLGVIVMTAVNSTVAMTITKMVNFGGDNRTALIALCAALFAIVLWATAAWWFGIPTSESHALIAGITGAAIALQGGLSGVNGAEWVKVIYGLFVSTFLGFGMGYGVCWLTGNICRNMDRRKTRGFFQKAQVCGGAAMAFMHGAQDGQKFMGILILGIVLVNSGDTSASFVLPVWLMILCSVVMGVGTSIGGKKIIKSVGMDMVKMETYQGFAADAAGALCLLCATLFGFPVSTTHTKTIAVMGVGAVKRASAINMGVVKDMVLTWILTFPGCGLIGFLMAKLFLIVF